MSAMRPTAVLLFATLATVGTAQRTWTVDRWNRPGTDFTDLPAAVTAAADGDIVFLRATSGLAIPADYYLAPTVRAKGLTIFGESGAGIPTVQVMGSGSVSDVPATSTLVFSNVDFGAGASGRLFFPLTRNPGAVVFRGVNFTGFSMFGPMLWTDCALIVLESCSMQLADGSFYLGQSTVMTSNTTMSKAAAQINNGVPAALVDGCAMHVHAGTAIGANTSASSPASCGEGFALTNGTTLQVSGGSSFQGGAGSSGFCEDLSGHNGVTTVLYDPSTVFAHGFVPTGASQQIDRTGIGTTTVGNTIHVDQTQPASTLTLLAMAPLSTSPWTNVLGPVYLDPNLVWTDFAFAPAAGPLRRSFALPPTLPKGLWVGVQGFALQPQTLAVLNSNVTIVGVW